MSGMVGDAELLLDQPCDALASPQGRGIAVCFGAVEQPLLQLRQLLGAELWLAPGATRMSQAAAFESFEIAFDSSRMTHAY